MPSGDRGSLDDRLAALRAQMEAGLPKRAGELRAAADRVASGDAQARADVRRLAHKLHGTAGTYGHEALGALAAEVERLEREGAPDAQLVSRTLALATATERASSGAGESTDASRGDAPPAPPRSAEVAAIPSLAGARILALDDDASTRKLLDLTLTTMGKADARIVESPERALETIACEVFDLVIVDAMMPSMTGLQFVEAMRARSSSHAARVAFLSAATHEELGWTLPEGAVWLRKPFRPRELLATIVRLLDGAPGGGG